MTTHVELIPVAEGKQIVLKPNEKLIVGRGSSLGCDDKKISRHHAELLLKDDGTVWITPLHTNPVFYRPAHGKTVPLIKDKQQDLQSESKDSTSAEENGAARKLPSWMSDSPEITSTATTLKRRLSAGKEKEPSPAKGFDAPDAPDETPTKKSKTTKDKPRAACPYGASCYRKNPIHRNEQSHPGDSDYEDEKKTDDEDKPICPYGIACYRQNPQHKQDYRH